MHPRSIPKLGFVVVAAVLTGLIPLAPIGAANPYYSVEGLYVGSCMTFHAQLVIDGVYLVTFESECGFAQLDHCQLSEGELGNTGLIVEPHTDCMGAIAGSCVAYGSFEDGLSDADCLGLSLGPARLEFRHSHLVQTGTATCTFAGTTDECSLVVLA